MAHSQTTGLQGSSTTVLSFKQGTPMVSSSQRPTIAGGGSYFPKAIRSLIVDDDIELRSTLSALLAAQPGFSEITEASYLEVATLAPEALRPQVLFVSCASFARDLSKLSSFVAGCMNPLLVLVTADRGDALLAYDLGAMDCLLRPFDKDRVRTSLARIRARIPDASGDPQAAGGLYSPHQHSAEIATVPDRLKIKDRNRTYIVKVDEVEWIAAAGDYVEIHLHGLTHLLRTTLVRLLGCLPPGSFCQIHRSAVVNIGTISAVKTLRNRDLLVRLKDRTVLRASRTYSNQLKEAVAKSCRNRDC